MWERMRASHASRLTRKRPSVNTMQIPYEGLQQRLVPLLLAMALRTLSQDVQ
jgi:hypothetical protein